MNAEPGKTDHLLESLDSLTKPVVTKIRQDLVLTGHTTGVGTHTVTMPPLLVQLQEAIGGSIGIGGSKGLPSERNMLDGDALLKFMTISSTITDWCRGVKAEPAKGDPALTLRRWFVNYRQVPRPSEKFHQRKMDSWRNLIEEKLDPPRTRELKDVACPNCEAKDWWNPADKLRYLHPLRVDYRPTGPDMIQQAVAKCLACEKTWGVRQLQYEIEMRDTLKEMNDTVVIPVRSMI